MSSGRDFLILLAGRLGSVALMLLSINLSTQHLSPGEYGALALLISFQLFCGLVLVNPVSQHLNRNTHAWQSEHVLSGALARMRAWIWISGVAGAVLLMTASPFLQLPNGAWVSALLVCAMVVAASWNGTFIWLLNMLGHRRSAVLWTLVGAGIGLAVSWAFARVWPTSLAWFSGQIFGMAFGALGARRDIGRALPGQAKWPADRTFIDRQTLLGYCLPLAGVTVFMWAQVSGYRTVVAEWWGLQALGMAAVGLGLANQVFNVVESVVMQFLYPMFYRRISNDDRDALPLSDLINTAGPIYVVVGAMVVAGSDAVVRLVVDEKYASSVAFVTLGAMAELARVLAGLLSNAAHLRRRTAPLIAPWVLAVAVSLAAMYVCFALHRSLEWGIGSLIVGGVALMLAMWVQMRRLARFSIDIGRWVMAICALVATLAYMEHHDRALESMSLALQRLSIASALGLALCAALLLKSSALRRLLSTHLQDKPAS